MPSESSAIPREALDTIKVIAYKIFPQDTDGSEVENIVIYQEDLKLLEVSLKDFVVGIAYLLSIKNVIVERTYDPGVVDYTEEPDPEHDTRTCLFQLIVPRFIIDYLVNPTRTQNNLTGSVSFDPNLSILKIGKKEFKILKSSDQYQYLKIIFENPSERGKEWFFDEILEKADSENKRGSKSCYNAFYQIRNKLLVAGASDLLDLRAHSVKLDPKYLS